MKGFLLPSFLIYMYSFVLRTVLWLVTTALPLYAQEKTPLSRKDYENLLYHADERHLPVYKTRRCFLYQNQHYQLDVYRNPCHERCRGLLLLETFTTHALPEVLAAMPPFLPIAREVTGDPAFSMFNLALR